RREIRSSRKDRYRFFPGIDEIRIDLVLFRIRSHAEDSVLRLENDLHARRNVVGHEGRHADAEVDEIPVAQLFGRSPDDSLARQRHDRDTVRRSMRFSRGATRMRCTNTPGVWTHSGSSSPGSTSSSTSAIEIFPAVAAIGLKLRAAFRYTRLP